MDVQRAQKQVSEAAEKFADAIKVGLTQRGSLLL